MNCLLAKHTKNAAAENKKAAQLFMLCGL